jgi:hypothetical protein
MDRPKDTLLADLAIGLIAGLACGRCKGGQSGQALSCSRGGCSTKLHLRCDANGLPLATVLTPGQAYESRAFEALVEDMAPGTHCLISDIGGVCPLARAAGPGGRRHGQLSCSDDALGEAESFEDIALYVRCKKACSCIFPSCRKASSRMTPFAGC